MGENNHIDVRDLVDDEAKEAGGGGKASTKKKKAKRSQKKSASGTPGKPVERRTSVRTTKTTQDEDSSEEGETTEEGDESDAEELSGDDEEFTKTVFKNGQACFIVDAEGQIITATKVKPFSSSRVGHFHLAGMRNCVLKFLRCWVDGSKQVELIRGELDKSKVHRGGFFHLGDRKGNFVIGFIRRVMKALPLRKVFLHTPIHDVLPTEAWGTSWSDRKRACNKMLAMHSLKTKKFDAVATMNSLFTGVELVIVERRLRATIGHPEQHVIMCNNFHAIITKPQCVEPNPVCRKCDSGVITLKELLRTF